MKSNVQYCTLTSWPTVLGTRLNAREAEDRLRRRGPLRPVGYFVDYRDYANRVRRAHRSVQKLAAHTPSAVALQIYTCIHHGQDIIISWPTNKKICVVDYRKMRYDVTARSLLTRYLPELEWLVPIGVVVSDGQTPYNGQNNPVVLVDSKGRLLMHVQKPLPWATMQGQESLYVICDDVSSFATEGLSHCDWCYSDIGGAPYGAVQDSELMTLCGAKNCLSKLLRVKRKLQGHAWIINGMPGVDKDRIFQIENNDTPQRILQAISSIPDSPPFHVLGYVTDDFRELPQHCDMCVLISTNCEIFMYIDSESRVFRIAKDIDMFFRMGTIKLYFNSELYQIDQADRWNVPTTENRPYILLKDDEVDPF